MDSDLVLIFTFITVVLAILGISVNSIVSKALKHKKWMEEHRSTKRSGASSERQDALEERVRVLERIVTENGPDDLTRQIEQLRDMDTIDQLTQSQEKTA
ncbi:hypothetical protein [Altererythrobacter sp. GH1-8]|uniref:hypothetical protein n=1 Tax=Altererythrobacter sp. GH1-8 TaxID=3349333 RepID=UPI00374CCF22